MNRYVRDGLLNDMREGRRVLYLGPTRGEARDLLGQLVQHLLPGETVHRTNGMERVNSPSGGWVRLHSVGSSVRGMNPDVLVVDGYPTPAQVAEIDVLAHRCELVRA